MEDNKEIKKIEILNEYGKVAKKILETIKNKEGDIENNGKYQ